jgi:hypothetical protein
MRNKTLCKIWVIGLVILVNGLVSVSNSPLLGEEKYVTVVLRDDTILKFDYDSFTMNWVVPQIKDELTCELFDFNPLEVDEIQMLTIGEDFCDKRDNWLFDLSFKDLGKPSIQGFIEVTEENVKGRLSGTGEVKVIPFMEIKKLIY